mmetsp:Transcript_22558/g.36717  ORF Transcript_22558/g.36717 Transcript_22558/m.36717 type:complete len:215 (-) Transcript_22558:222-866(-)
MDGACMLKEPECGVGIERPIGNGKVIHQSKGRHRPPGERALVAAPPTGGKHGHTKGPKACIGRHALFGAATVFALIDNQVSADKDQRPGENRAPEGGIVKVTDGIAKTGLMQRVMGRQVEHDGQSNGDQAHNQRQGPLIDCRIIAARGRRGVSVGADLEKCHKYLSCNGMCPNADKLPLSRASGQHGWGRLEQVRARGFTSERGDFGRCFGVAS